jgi:hypothetical protein
MRYTSDQLLTLMTQGKTKSRKLLLRDASIKYLNKFKAKRRLI